MCCLLLVWVLRRAPPVMHGVAHTTTAVHSKQVMEPCKDKDEKELGVSHDIIFRTYRCCVCWVTDACS
jgi:hypothetical protein